MNISFTRFSFFSFLVSLLLALTGMTILDSINVNSCCCWFPTNVVGIELFTQSWSSPGNGAFPENCRTGQTKPGAVVLGGATNPLCPLHWLLVFWVAQLLWLWGCWYLRLTLIWLWRVIWRGGQEIGQVKMPQSFLFLLRFRQFSWINTP